MSNTIRRLVIAGAFLVLLPASVLAVPLVISYQGRLTDDAGVPVTGDRPMVFSMYTTATGGGAIWTESRTVTAADGVFSVDLGSVSPIPFMTFQTDMVYLGVSVGTDAEMTPRQRLASVGYAYKAAAAFNADMLEGMHAYDLAPAAHSHSGDDVTSAVAEAGHAITADTAASADNADTLGGQSASDIIDAASAGGVPSGFMIIGEDPTPPPGYTYTGWSQTISVASSWSAKAPMPTARRRFAAAAVNNRVYVMGGANAYYLTINEEYDPATDTWTTKTPMKETRENLAAATVNNKIYAIGGRVGSSYIQANEEYDPVSNTWTSKSPMPTARQYLAMAVVNGKVYALGGDNGSGYSPANEEYDPDADSWTTKASMPAARTFLAAAAVNGKVYAIGGLSSSSKNEEYDTATDTWATKASMPTARYSLAAASLNGKIYVIGGSNGSVLNNNEEYDPESDSWTSKIAMPTSRKGLAAVAANGKIYAIGGGDLTDYFIANEEYTPDNKVLYIHVKD